MARAAHLLTLPNWVLPSQGTGPEGFSAPGLDASVLTEALRRQQGFAKVFYKHLSEMSGSTCKSSSLHSQKGKFFFSFWTLF